MVNGDDLYISQNGISELQAALDLDRQDTFKPTVCRSCHDNNRVSDNVDYYFNLEEHLIIELDVILPERGPPNNSSGGKKEKDKKEDRTKNKSADMKDNTTYANLSDGYALKDIPKYINILGIKYKLVGCGAYSGAFHFLSYVNTVDDKWIKYDDLHQAPEYVDANTKRILYIIFYVEVDENT